MILNGIEVSFNIAEENSNKRVMEALESVSKDAENAAGKESYAQIHDVCTSIKNAFDYIFGPGSGERICGKENDYNVCAIAFAEVIEEKNRQDEIMKQTISRLNKAVGSNSDELSD